MTKISLFVISLFMSLTSVAQNGYWAWARTGQDMGFSVANDVATDDKGNVYTIGNYETQLFLGGGTLVSMGVSDVFLAAYSSTGQLIWEKSIGGAGTDIGKGIALDDSGNVFIAGSFENSIDISGVQMTGNGGVDIFIAKYNSGGNLIWAKHAGSEYDESLTDILVDKTGEIYLGGVFAQSNMGTVPEYISCYFDSDSVVSKKGSRIFLAKYNRDGEAIWAKGMGGFGGGDQLHAIGLDGFGNVNIGGTCVSYFEVGQVQLISNSSGWVMGELFVAKLNSIGNPLWAKMVWGSNTVGGGKGGAQPGMLRGGKIASDEDGNVILTGSFSDCNIFFPPYQLNNSGSFMAKYTAGGSLAWVKGNEQLNYSTEGLTCNKRGEICVVGTVSGSGLKIGSDIINPSGSANIFVGKYDTDGNGICGTVVQGDGIDIPKSILTAGDNALYISGGYQSSSLQFGNDELSSYLNSTKPDIFVASYYMFPTGIANGSNLTGLATYPNPFTDVLYINGMPDNTTIIVRDLSGREIVRKQTHSKTATIELGHLCDALYLVTAIDSDGDVIGTSTVMKY